MFLNLLPEENKKDFMVLANSMMMADGIQAAEELAKIKSYCHEMNIDGFEFKEDMLDDAVKSLGNLSLSLKKAVYLEIYALAVSDNDFDNGEQVLLKKLQNAFGITDTDKDKIRNVCDEYIAICNKMTNILK